MLDSQTINDIIIWDVTNWSKFLAFCDRFLPDNHETMLSLEIGARAGGLSLFLALKGYSVVCSDLYSPESIAKKLHEKYHLGDKITYDAIDVVNIHYPDNFFDLVVFKSVLGGLTYSETQQQAMSEIHRILKPGGRLLFAENAKSNKLYQLLRGKVTLRTTYWTYLSLEEVADMCSPFSEVILESYGLLGCLGWNEPIRKVLGTIDTFVESLVPSKWKYIIFGYARK